MTREEAEAISSEIGLIVRQVSDLQVSLPAGTALINGLCYSAAVLLFEAQRQCSPEVVE